jgi:enoyl-CoA hydratase
LSPVLLDIADRIATVTLNRPEARNALSSVLLRALKTVMAECEASSEVDVIILTGTDPAFSAGLDLKELGSTGGNLGQPSTPEGDTAVTNLPWAPVSKPIIGAVNGVAITGGFELALLCDFLIASERASFGDTHTRVGILPGWGLSVNLPATIGQRRAIEMSMTGNFIGADEALRLGLVNHVVAHDELLPAARKLASDIVANNTGAVRTLLASYRAMANMTAGDAFAHELTVSRSWMRQTYAPEAVEARRAAIMERGRNQGAG